MALTAGKGSDRSAVAGSDRADDLLALSLVLGLGQDPTVPEGLQPGQPLGRVRGWDGLISGAGLHRGDGLGTARAEQGVKHLACGRPR